VAEPPVTFAALLRRLRAEARLTQEELAEASGVRPRSISDLERGVALAPQRETIRRLADGLGLTGPVRVQFEAVARGRAVPATTGAADIGGAAAATRTLPRDIASFIGRHQELQEAYLHRVAGQYVSRRSRVTSRKTFPPVSRTRDRDGRQRYRAATDGNRRQPAATVRAWAQDGTAGRVVSEELICRTGGSGRVGQG